MQVTFPLELPFLRLRTVEGLPTMIAAYTTDIPELTNWGEPLLIGPGSIHVAHTDGEYIEKRQLADAIDLYCAIAKSSSQFWVFGSHAFMVGPSVLSSQS